MFYFQTCFKKAVNLGCTAMCLAWNTDDDFLFTVFLRFLLALVASGNDKTA